MSKQDNSYIKKKDGIEIDAKDPIYDVLSEEEIDEASERFSSLLDEANETE